MTSTSTMLLRRLHEQSQTEVMARARAQFQGSSEEFLTLAEEVMYCGEELDRFAANPL